MKPKNTPKPDKPTITECFPASDGASCSRDIVAAARCRTDGNNRRSKIGGDLANENRPNQGQL
jgi:hypothetical protein